MAGETQTLYIYAQFYDKDNYASNAQKPFSGAFLSPLAFQFSEEKSQITQISVTFSYTPPETYGTQYSWSDYIKQGRRMTLWVAHTYTSPATQIPIGTFIIDNIEQSKTGDDRHLIVSGPELTQELAEKLLYTPIGTYKADIARISVAAPAPHTTTLAAPAPPNNDNLILTAASWAKEDDEVRLTLDTGHIHITTIKEVIDNTVVLNQRIPTQATIGKPVTIRKRKILVDHPELFYEGDIIKIYRDSGGNPPYDSYIIEGIDEETNDITLSRGLLDGAAINKVVMREDYSTPTTNDVNFVLEDAYPDISWGYVMQAGRASATALATRGASAYATLKQIADIHGEYFLANTLTTASPTMLPQRLISWRHTCNPLDIELVQVKTQSEFDAAWAANQGIVISFVERIARPPIDTVYVKGAGAGLSQITLANCTPAVVTEVLTQYGYTLTGNPGDIYKPYKLVNPGLNIHREKLITIDVLPETASPEAIGSAADMMLRQAAAYLYTMSQTAKEYSVRIQCRQRIRAGDRVRLTYSDPAPGDGHSYSRAYFQVISVTMDISTEGMYYDLTISTSLDPNESEAPTDESTVSAEIIKFIRLRESFDAMPTLGNFRSAVYDGRPVITPGTVVYTAGDAIAISPTNEISVVASALAGWGMEVSGNDLKPKLAPNSGLVVDSTGLYAVAPGTLSATTTNDRSAGTHAITATSNAKSTPGALLKGDPNGDLTGRIFTLDKLISPEVESTTGPVTLDPASGLLIVDGNLQFTGARSITTDTGSLTLAPTDVLVLDPSNNVAQINATTTIKTANAQVGVFPQTGWQINYPGDGYFTSLLADELHVAAFIADISRVRVGGIYATPGMALIRRDMTIPAVGGTATLYVEDIPGWPNLAVFETNDWVLLRIVNRDSGGLIVANAWGQVTNYTDRADGEQSWTFTCRIATSAVGKIVRAGDEAMSYGKSGSFWWYTTVMDPGGPHSGFGTWQGENPTSNISYPIRMGQLIGVSGRNELGFQAGVNMSSVARFSTLGGEIHGSRMSLYAGDNAQLRVRAVRVLHYRSGSLISYLLPNTDHSVQSILKTGTTTYYSQVDENPASPTTTDYIYNGPNQSGYIFMGLQTPTWNGITYQVSIHANIEVAGITNDTIRLYGQVFQSDELTPLASEKLIYTGTTNTTATVTVNCDTAVTDATQQEWIDARLRLRWEYEINSGEEAIRLDPNVPSIAVGNPLPINYTEGGSGFWVGNLNNGYYGLRIGNANGTALRWDGASLRLKNSANVDVIVLEGSGGNSYFAGAMSLGLEGGIWQGTATLPAVASFSNPQNGLKIYSESNQGRIALFSGGKQYLTLRHDRGLEIANDGPLTPSAAINFVTAPNGPIFGSLSAFKADATSVSEYKVTNGIANSGVQLDVTGSGARAVFYAGSTALYMNSTYDYASLTDADLLIEDGGLAIGLASAPNLPRGVLAMDANGEHNNNMMILKDTGKIVHGMTALVDTMNYGVMGKANNDYGGLKIWGFAGGVTAGVGTIGISASGFVRTAVNGLNTGTHAPIYLNGAKQNGTNVQAVAANEHILAIASNYAVRMIVNGDGSIHLDTTLTQNSYDDYDDVALLRSADLALAGKNIDAEYGRWLKYNRADLEAAGLMNGTFVDFTRMQRLITGAVWQLAERVRQLEAQLA